MTMLSKQQRSSALNSGFTLLEMLLALALLSVISALVWQALASLARVEQRLEDTALFASDHALRRQWLAQALAGMMTGPRGDALEPQGNAQVLEAMTTAPPWPGSWGPQTMRLRLRPDGGDTVLEVQPLPPSPPPGAPPRVGEDSLWVTMPPATMLWRWGGSSRWQYLDEAGQWHEQWPPASTTLALGADASLPALRLPKAVALLGAPGGPLLVAPQAGDNPMQSQRSLMEEP